VTASIRLRQPAPAPLGWVVVRGRSMEPTLRDGDRLLVAYRGTVLVGRLVVVDLPPGRDGPRPTGVKRLRAIDPAGALVVSSDNPTAGTDSATFGPLPPDALRARVLLRVPRLSRPARRTGGPA
jgi:phage repressor protein C with HTH and peptisase S24 domain